MRCDGCFARKGNGRCAALIIDKTQGVKTCVFYKTVEAQRRGRRKALAHISTLDEAQQDHIAEKYFNGVRAW